MEIMCVICVKLEVAHIYAVTEDYFCLMKLSDCRSHLLTYLIIPNIDFHLNSQLY